MTLTRRSFLTGAGLAGGSFLAGSFLWPSRANSASTALRIPELIDARTKGQAIVLTAQSGRSEEHTSELQSLMRNSYAVFCLKKKTISTVLITKTILSPPTISALIIYKFTLYIYII